MAIIEDIVKFIVDTKFEDIPEKTIERQKELLIDTIGVGIAGLNSPGVKEIIKIIKEIGGKKESSVLATQIKCPSFLAGMANSFMIHSLDFDDMHEKAGVHANVCAFPAALAMAEKVGNIDGKTLITAVILGVDLVCRMGLAVPIFRGWHITTTFGVYGATASSAKILKLDEKKMVNAFGIAYCQSSGNRQGRLEGTLTKRLQPALATKSGVLSSILASKGITGPKNIFEGDWGIIKLYGSLYKKDDEKEKYLKKLTENLGKDYLSDELSIKPFPSCKATHTSIEAVINIMKRNNLKPKEIDEVEIFVSKGCYDTAGRPFEIRTNPQVDAQFSIPYTVATAILNGNVGLDDFVESVIKKPERLEMARKIKVSVDPMIKDESTNVVNLESKVFLKAKGKIFSFHSSISKGHPMKPLNKDEIFSKFESCLRFGKHFSYKKIKKIFSTLLKFEEIKDIRSLVRLIAS